MSKEVEVKLQDESMLEERLRKMLAKDLTKEEEEDYINMFQRYPHFFITDYSMIKGVDVIQHHSDLKLDAKAVAQKLRRLGVVQQEALLFEVNRVLKADFIYPETNSEWISPVVVTRKKNGKWRVCVDYKPLNATTKRDHFSLPSQDEILNEVAEHECYTVCDGYSCYYQIRIAQEDQHKNTFITPWGCFAFRIMPFGLTNAPSTFTRVEEGLQRLYPFGGQLNPDKCHVAEKEVVLLGHVISQEGIKIDPSHVQAILDLPPPNSARQVITFVQKVRYMSCFIHLLSQVISPLQQLANQEVLSWDQEHLECFNEVKEVLGSLPTIMPPDPQGTYYLCPSVGLDAFGVVLMQKDPKTSYMRPIYFTSKVMTQGQKGYTDIEQLVFSLIVAIRKFRSYLLPKPFIILTLEHNLPYTIQHMSISSKISKWVLELQEYEYTFIVENSTRASLADILTYKVKEKKITPKAQGPIPSTLGLLPLLTDVRLFVNSLCGNFPTFLYNCSNLEYLGLQANDLTGSLLLDIQALKHLKYFSAYGNQISETIPEQIGACKSLQYLYLQQNQLTGSIPSTLENLTTLIELDLAANKLSGPLPSGILTFQNLTWLSLGSNQRLNVSISDLTRLRKLEYLTLYRNQFTGSIPETLDQFKELIILRLNQNHLTGQIPSTIGNLQSLNEFSVWGNQLSGNIPEATGIHLPDILEKNLLRLTAIELERATNGFNEENVIGHGGFSIVYKAKLEDGKNVVVKLFKNHESAAPKAFLSELHTLGQLRHRNLTRILGYCSNLDIKAVIMDLMHGGNLDKHLHDLSNEYACSSNPTTKGDVFSYGINLMELVTGKRPTSTELGQGMTIQAWAAQRVLQNLENVIGPNLLRTMEDLDEQSKKEIYEQTEIVIQMGLRCACESPYERLNMKQTLLLKALQCFEVGKELEVELFLVVVGPWEGKEQVETWEGIVVILEMVKEEEIMQGVGKQEELKLSQNEWLCMKIDEEDDVLRAPAPTTRLKRRLEPVDKEEEQKKKGKTVKSKEQQKKKGKTVKSEEEVAKETRSQRAAQVERLLEAFRLERTP
ncbi:hypothetical protein L7F22_058298 [Adiantum nelumboides]|nr:hypothetical protein [Adiantum nelumboides]